MSRVILMDKEQGIHEVMKVFVNGGITSYFSQNREYMHSTIDDLYSRFKGQAQYKEHLRILVNVFSGGELRFFNIDNSMFDRLRGTSIDLAILDRCYDKELVQSILIPALIRKNGKIIEV